MFVVDKDHLQTSQPHMQIQDANFATQKLFVDELTQRLIEKGKEAILLAVDVTGNNRAVWKSESTEWVEQCKLPDECPREGVCVSRVCDGLVVAGGRLAICQPKDRICVSEVHERLLVAGGNKRWSTKPPVLSLLLNN